jgi:hypothetical protein
VIIILWCCCCLRDFCNKIICLSVLPITAVYTTNHNICSPSRRIAVLHSVIFFISHLLCLSCVHVSFLTLFYCFSQCQELKNTGQIYLVYWYPKYLL